MKNIQLKYTEEGKQFLIDATGNMLITGETGCGKSVLEMDILCQVLEYKKHSNVNMYLLDVKNVEFKHYANYGVEGMTFCDKGSVLSTDDIVEFLESISAEFKLRIDLLKNNQEADLIPIVIMISEFRDLYSIKNNNRILHLFDFILSNAADVNATVICSCQKIEKFRSAGTLNKFKHRLALKNDINNICETLGIAYGFNVVNFKKGQILYKLANDMRIPSVLTFKFITDNEVCELLKSLNS